MTAVMAERDAPAVLPVASIVKAADNPRRNLGDLTELKASIAALGILQPLLVVEEDDGYRLVAGERRLTAATELGMLEVPVAIRSFSEIERKMAMLVENVQRVDLLPVEEARTYVELADLGLTQRQLADMVGRSQAHISKRVALLDLPDAVQAKVGVTAGAGGKKADNAGISVTNAAELLKLKDHPKVLADVVKNTAGEPDMLPHAVERALKQIAADEKRSAIAGEAAAKGWKVVQRPKGYSERPAYQKISKDKWDQGIKVDVRAHRKEPCHGVLIEDLYQGPAKTEVCTEPDRHKAKGASAVKVPVEKRQADSQAAREREAAKARKEAAGLRADWMRPRLAKTGGTLQQGEVVRLLARSVIDQLGYDQRKVACDLLGLEQPQHRNDVLWEEAAKSHDDLVRVALACALARGHVNARQPYHGWTARDVQDVYHFCLHTGYLLSNFEALQLGKAEEEANTEERDDLIDQIVMLQVDLEELGGQSDVTADQLDGADLAELQSIRTELESVIAASKAAGPADDGLVDENGCPHLLVGGRQCAQPPGHDGPHESAALTDEDLHELGVGQAVIDGVREMKDELDAEGLAHVVTVAKAGPRSKKYSWTCTCGATGTNTTEAYAQEAGDLHVAKTSEEVV